MKRLWPWLRQPIPFIDAIELALTVAILLLIWFEFQAGNRQIVALGTLNNNVANEGQALKNLTTTESKLLSSMQTANDNFQASLGITKQTNGAMRNQLAILEAEQRARLAEAAKKPLIAAKVENTPLNDKPGTHINPRTITSTSSVFDLVLKNVGTARLVNGVLTVYIQKAPNVTLSCRGCFEVPEPPDFSARQLTYEVALGRMLPTVSELITMTVRFPKGRAPFKMTFGVGADNYPQTNLGSVTMTPPRE